jgi:hypothetical protein
VFVHKTLGFRGSGTTGERGRENSHFSMTITSETVLLSSVGLHIPSKRYCTRSSSTIISRLTYLYSNIYSQPQRDHSSPPSLTHPQYLKHDFKSSPVSLSMIEPNTTSISAAGSDISSLLSDRCSRNLRRCGSWWYAERTL